MQFLQGRHPEIAMRLALPIKPRCPSFLSSHTQKVWPCVACWQAILFFIAAVADASFKWPSQMHLSFIFSSTHEKQGQKRNKSLSARVPRLYLIPCLQRSPPVLRASPNCFALRGGIGLL